MTITEFLTKHCKGKYTTIDELYQHRSEVLKPGESDNEFIPLLTRWFNLHSDGYMSNGMVYYTELPFGRTKKVIRLKRGKNVALVMVARLVFDKKVVKK